VFASGNASELMVLDSSSDFKLTFGGTFDGQLAATIANSKPVALVQNDADHARRTLSRHGNVRVIV
jgi:hypothetical protein